MQANAAIDASADDAACGTTRRWTVGGRFGGSATAPGLRFAERDNDEEKDELPDSGEEDGSNNDEWCLVPRKDVLVRRQRRLKACSTALASTVDSLPGLHPTQDYLPDVCLSRNRTSFPLAGGDVPDVQPLELEEESDEDEDAERGAAGGKTCPEVRKADALGPAVGEKGEKWCFSRSSSFHPSSSGIGKPLRVRSASAGRVIDAVTIDTNGDKVKVFYCLGKRCFTKVVKLCELNGGASLDADMLAMGAPVLVHSSSINIWFKGVVTASDAKNVQVRFKHNGLNYTKTLARTSPDLRTRPLLA